MARETKVGLLTGLAFIVCFAIILANRGRSLDLPEYRPYRVDQGVPVRESVETARQRPPHGSDARARRAVDRGNGFAGLAGERPSERGASARPVAGRSGHEAGSSGAVLVLPAPSRTVERPLDRPVNARGPDRHAAAERRFPAAEISSENGLSALTRERAPDRPPAAGGPPKADPVVGNPSAGPTSAGAISAPDAGVAPSDQEPVLRRSVSDRGSASAGSVAREPAGGPPKAGRRRAAARYEVVAGDTLTRIAQRHYGTRSKRVIDAIFDANRATLSSPDTIRVGMELVLPPIAGLARATRAGGAGTSGSAASAGRVSFARTGGGAKGFVPPSVTGRSGRGADAATFRWYQIKKGDRYVTIARDELGDAGRWREIYELNEDKFPDPDHIRDGVRIKLPVDRVAHGATAPPGGNGGARTTRSGTRP